MLRSFQSLAQAHGEAASSIHVHALAQRRVSAFSAGGVGGLVRYLASPSRRRSAFLLDSSEGFKPHSRGFALTSLSSESDKTSDKPAYEVNSRQEIWSLITAAMKGRSNDNASASTDTASLSRLLEFARPEARPISLAFATVGVTSGIQLLFPLAFGHILDLALQPVPALPADVHPFTPFRRDALPRGSVLRSASHR